jgi:transposase
MGRVKTIIDEALAAKARYEWERLKDQRLATRLLAVVKAYEWPIGEVAEFLGVARDSVSRWIKRFRAEGLEGLYDKAKGHNPAKLSEDQLKQIAAWLEAGKDSEGRFVHWTIPRLRQELEHRFRVRIGQTPLRGHVKRLGFKLKVPRPAHAKADAALQAEFKKNRRGDPSLPEG